MTPEHYDEAVNALAVLISNYWSAHPEVFRENDPAGSSTSLPVTPSTQPPD